MTLSIIVPAYNEENAIAPVMEKLVAQMAQSGLTYEILVIDDGSQDSTAHIAQQIEGITLLRHRRNKGYGAALKTGIRHAQYGLLCITDADGTYPNGRIPDLVHHPQLQIAVVTLPTELLDAPLTLLRMVRRVDRNE